MRAFILKGFYNATDKRVATVKVGILTDVEQQTVSKVLIGRGFFKSQI